MQLSFDGCDSKAKWKHFHSDIRNTFDTKLNFSTSSFQNMSEINKITSETRFEWILNFVCFFSAFLRFSSLECYDGIRVVDGNLLISLFWGHWLLISLMSTIKLKEVRMESFKIGIPDKLKVSSYLSREFLFN